MRKLFSLLVMIPAAFLSLLPPVQAGAEGPAANGRILFEGWGGGWASWETFGPNSPTYDLWAVDPDGSDLVNLTTSLGADSDGAWSPDGKKIVFTSNRDGDYDLYVMSSDGSGLKQLTDASGNEAFPSWSPDARHIVYSDDRSGNEDIWIIRSDGSGARKLRAVHSDAWEFSWSPDGRRIAFTATSKDGDDDDIFVMNRDGSGLKTLVGGANRDCCLDWSPDGRRFVFQRNFKRCAWLSTERCDADVMLGRLGRISVKNITSTPDGMEWDPAWSPDGGWIVFSKQVDKAPILDSVVWESDLFVMKPDGSGLRRVVSKPDTEDYASDWQPVRGQ